MQNYIWLLLCHAFHRIVNSYCPTTSSFMFSATRSIISSHTLCDNFVCRRLADEHFQFGSTMLKNPSTADFFKKAKLFGWYINVDAKHNVYVVLLTDRDVGWNKIRKSASTFCILPPRKSRINEMIIWFAGCEMDGARVNGKYIFNFRRMSSCSSELERWWHHNLCHWRA